ncbi:hypothetical protein [Microbacterium pumilum]|uniref:Uncharacterized protein n=1 Tax=Microbacterium pumilum TaxID=344165 RepID=A0ABN2S372_9MICO
MMARSSQRRAVTWAVLGAVVLTAGVIAILITSIGSEANPNGAASPSQPAGATKSTSPSPSPRSTVVDASVVESGWVPEPVTRDADAYARAALSAAGTFDTQKSTYEDWITYLGSWFTPDTRYSSETDRQTELEAAKLELRQSVVLPEDDWISLDGERGRVSSAVAGEVQFVPAPQDTSGDMTIGTADVTVTYTRSDGGSGEVTYDESARLSVQVLCGPDTVPAPSSSQRRGDCKVVRFLAEPVEP